MKTKEIGDLGENIACNFLKKKKYKILEKNYKKTYGEIDIIARKGDTISFVEVKTRKNRDYGLACQAVNYAKKNKIIKTAYTYINEKNLNMDYSFDIIEIYYDDGKVLEISHIENAFS